MAVWGPTSIAADADDGHYVTSSSTWNNRTDEGYPGGETFQVSKDMTNYYYGAVRFQNVTIAAGATINEALLRVYINVGDPGQMDAAQSIITIFADVGANRQDVLGASHHPLSNWTNSTASVQVTSLATASPRAIDITSVIQELVDLGGWASGDDICLSLDPAANGSDTYWGLTIADYDADTTAPTLEIDYTEGGASAPKRSLLLGIG